MGMDGKGTPTVREHDWVMCPVANFTSAYQTNQTLTQEDEENLEGTKAAFKDSREFLFYRMNDGLRDT
jgi:hypothetical protein